MALQAQKKEREMDMEEMMEVYRKLGAPGAPHRHLASLAGSWTTRTRAWMEPGNPRWRARGPASRG